MFRVITTRASPAASTAVIAIASSIRLTKRALR